VATAISKFMWRQEKKFVDGSDFTAEHFGGFTFEIDGKPAVSVPVGWDEDGLYELPIADIVTPLYGEHTARMNVVTKAGVPSDWTPLLTFMVVDDRKPSAPFSLAVQ
jgi:hypothetical protein